MQDCRASLYVADSCPTRLRATLCLCRNTGSSRHLCPGNSIARVDCVTKTDAFASSSMKANRSLRIDRVDGQIRATRLQNAQDTYENLWRAIHEKPHENVGPDAQAFQYGCASWLARRLSSP